MLELGGKSANIVFD
ncbi:MAG: hypothetical protein ACTMKY_15105, partial [Dermabacteraceae bacterium]